MKDGFQTTSQTQQAQWYLTQSSKSKRHLGYHGRCTACVPAISCSAATNINGSPAAYSYK